MVCCRIMQDIIWSCVATIFACARVAVHPNVPGPHDSECKKLNQRLLVMFYAMLASGFMTTWALRQRIGAGKHANDYNEKFYPGVEPRPWSILQFIKNWFRDPAKEVQDGLWTITRGFHLVQGLVRESGDAIEDVLTIRERLDITQDEINDKSKGDFLTGRLVVVQTLWFTFQCLARWISHLHLTELEVVTLAFALLNIITCILWWDKPQNIYIPILVQRYRRLDTSPETKETEKRDASGTEGGVQNSDGETTAKPVSPYRGPHFKTRFIGGTWAVLMHVGTFPHPRTWGCTRLDEISEFIMAPIAPLIGMLSNNDTDSALFYSSQNGVEGWITFLPICLIGSPFPPYLERSLWRLAAFRITVQPFVFSCMRVFGDLNVVLE